MRTESYETIKGIIRKTTIEMKDGPGTTLQETYTTVVEENPELSAELGTDRVLVLCREIHASNEPEESARLQQLFEIFNTKYFDGKLSGFSALAAYNVTAFTSKSITGCVDFPNQRIYVQLTKFRDWATHDLLEQMAHAATNTSDNSDRKWMNEIQRLARLGAPLHPDS